MNGLFYKMLVYIASKFKWDVDIKVNSEKITYVDAAHVAMCEIVSEKPITVEGYTNNYVSLMGVMAKCVKVDKKTDLSFSTNEKNELLVSTNTGVVNFSIGGFNPAVSEPKVPELILNGKFKVGFKDFDKIIDDIGDITDHVKFFFENDTLTVRSYGLDGIIFEKSMKIENLNECNNPIMACFSIEYIRKILGSNLNKTDMTFEADTDYPIRISWDLLDGANELHSVKWLLAPRIEVD